MSSVNGTSYTFEGQRMHMPDRTRCVTCKVIKPLSAFSNKRANELQTRLFHHPSTTVKHMTEGVVPCGQCTDVLQELKCSACHESKDLDDFDKAQRKDPRSAQCKVCKAHNERTVDLTLEGVPARHVPLVVRNGWVKPPPANKTYMAPPKVTEGEVVAKSPIQEARFDDDEDPF